MRLSDKMCTIIPSINVLTFREVQERIKKIEPYVSWCHFDVTDGIFSTHPTWRNPADLSLLRTTLNVEVHLMVEEPEKIIDKWLVKPITRVIIHLEASKDIDGIIEKCRETGIACGIAIRPDTSWNMLIPWLGKADLIQILAVHPGPSGQKMNPEIFDKIRHVREACSSCIIEMDGGINPETAVLARSAGANLMVSAGYIFSQSDIGKAIEELRTCS